MSLAPFKHTHTEKPPMSQCSIGYCPSGWRCDRTNTACYQVTPGGLVPPSGQPNCGPNGLWLGTVCIAAAQHHAQR